MVQQADGELCMEEAQSNKIAIKYICASRDTGVLLRIL